LEKGEVIPKCKDSWQLFQVVSGTIQTSRKEIISNSTTDGIFVDGIASLIMGEKTTAVVVEDALVNIIEGYFLNFLFQYFPGMAASYFFNFLNKFSFRKNYLLFF